MAWVDISDDDLEARVMLSKAQIIFEKHGSRSESMESTRKVQIMLEKHSEDEIERDEFGT